MIKITSSNQRSLKYDLPLIRLTQKERAKRAMKVFGLYFILAVISVLVLNYLLKKVFISLKNPMEFFVTNAELNPIWMSFKTCLASFFSKKTTPLS